MKFLVWFFAIILLTAAISFAVLQSQYRVWPEYLWARRVRRRLQELRDRLEYLRNPPRNERSAAEQLAEDLFEQQKSSVAVEALIRFQGIGPKTVEGLRQAGIRNLAQAEDHASAFLFKKKIGNVGSVREAAIAAGVEQLLADEHRRFEAGTSPEGEQYRQKLAQFSAQEQERAAARARECSAIVECLAKIQALEDLTVDLSFWNYLFHREVPGLTEEVMAAPLPSVEIPPAPPAPFAKPVQRKDSASAPIPRAIPVPPPPVSPPIVRKPAAVPAPIPRSPIASPPTAEAPAASPLQAKLRAYCRFAYIVAKADGRVAQSEKAEIRRFLGEQFGSDPVLLRHLDPELEQAEANVPTEEQAVAEIKALTDRSERAALYGFAETVADATGERNDKEKQFLARLAAAFGIAETAPASKPLPAWMTEPHVTAGLSIAAKNAPAPRAEIPLPSKADARTVLEIPAKAEITIDLVRRKFAFLTDQLNPEKAAALGADFARMAEAKRAAIAAAAQELLKPFGAPLAVPDKPAAPTELRHNPDLDDVFGA